MKGGYEGGMILKGGLGGLYLNCSYEWRKEGKKWSGPEMKVG
jgi:hypothetical protein